MPVAMHGDAYRTLAAARGELAIHRTFPMRSSLDRVPVDTALESDYLAPQSTRSGGWNGERIVPFGSTGRHDSQRGASLRDTLHDLGAHEREPTSLSTLISDEHLRLTGDGAAVDPSRLKLAMVGACAEPTRIHSGTPGFPW